VLTKLSSDESELVLTCTLLNSAKFWIENRQKTARDILDFVITQKSLKARYDEAKSNGDDVNVSNFANDYNKLTEKWGFA
jgi:mannitol-specific phosphotransferase system IIBC component